MDRQALAIAAGLGTAAQLVLVTAGHFVPSVADNLFAPGGVALAFLVGLIYVRKSVDERHHLRGGALAAAIPAFLGILLSVILGDVYPVILLLGTLAAAMAGMAGAALGHALAAGRRPPA